MLAETLRGSSLVGRRLELGLTPKPTSALGRVQGQASQNAGITVALTHQGAGGTGLPTPGLLLFPREPIAEEA